MKLSIIEYVIGGIIIAGLLLIGFLLILNPGSDLNISQSIQNQSSVLQQANNFIEYRRTLASINIDTTFFSDNRLINFQLLDTSIAEQPIGKQELFEASQ